MELETRHYIGVTPLGRMHATLGPGEPSSFTLAATEPIPVGDTWLYPVSFEVAEEWDSFDEESDEAGWSGHAGGCSESDEDSPGRCAPDCPTRQHRPDTSIPRPTGYPTGGS